MFLNLLNVLNQEICMTSVCFICLYGDICGQFYNSIK